MKTIKKTTRKLHEEQTGEIPAKKVTLNKLLELLRQEGHEAVLDDGSIRIETETGVAWASLCAELQKVTLWTCFPLDEPGRTEETWEWANRLNAESCGPRFYWKEGEASEDISGPDPGAIEAEQDWYYGGGVTAKTISETVLRFQMGADAAFGTIAESGLIHP